MKKALKLIKTLFFKYNWVMDQTLRKIEWISSENIDIEEEKEPFIKFDSVMKIDDNSVSERSKGWIIIKSYMEELDKVHSLSDINNAVKMLNSGLSILSLKTPKVSNFMIYFNIEQRN